MPKVLKQATLSSLKGVVVYEDILRCKTRLETENQSLETLLDSLAILAAKKPCREALLKTDIYSTVENLCQHHEAEVADSARHIVSGWKGVLECKTSNSKPLLEVRYDLETMHFRKTALQFFVTELGSTERNKKLADALEKEIFHKCHKLVKGAYRKTTRKIIFVLRHDANERISLQQGKILPMDFVNKYAKL